MIDNVELQGYGVKQDITAEQTEKKSAVSSVIGVAHIRPVHRTSYSFASCENFSKLCVNIHVGKHEPTTD